VSIASRGYHLVGQGVDRDRGSVVLVQAGMTMCRYDHVSVNTASGHGANPRPPPLDPT